MHKALLTTTISLAAALPAQALTVGTLPGDGAFLSLPFEEAFVAEGRIGIEGPGDWELGLYGPGHNGLDQSEFSWTSGGSVPFSLALNGDGLMTYQFGQEAMTFAPDFADGFNSLALRTRSTDASSVALTGLQLNGASVTADAVSSLGEAGASYLLLTGITGALNSFQLTGMAEMAWLAGERPTRSHLAFQLKGGSLPGLPGGEPGVETAVPEPSFYGLVGAVLLGGLIAGRRLRHRRN